MIAKFFPLKINDLSSFRPMVYWDNPTGLHTPQPSPLLSSPMVSSAMVGLPHLTCTQRPNDPKSAFTLRFALGVGMANGKCHPTEYLNKIRKYKIQTTKSTKKKKGKSPEKTEKEEMWNKLSRTESFSGRKGALRSPVKSMNKTPNLHRGCHCASGEGCVLK